MELKQTKSGLYGYEDLYDDNEANWRKNVRNLLTASRKPDMYGLCRKIQNGQRDSGIGRKKGK